MSVGKNTREIVFTRDLNVCVYCGSKYQLTIDHIMPLCKGGTSELTNLQTLCRPCNQRKGNLKNSTVKRKVRMALHPRQLLIVLDHDELRKKYTPPEIISEPKPKPQNKRKEAEKLLIALQKQPEQQKVLTASEWALKLEKTYPHAYSSVEPRMWTWIYDNLILKQIE